MNENPKFLFPYLAPGLLQNQNQIQIQRVLQAWTGPGNSCRNSRWTHTLVASLHVHRLSVCVQKAPCLLVSGSLTGPDPTPSPTAPAVMSPPSWCTWTVFWLNVLLGCWSHGTTNRSAEPRAACDGFSLLHVSWAPPPPLHPPLHPPPPRRNRPRSDSNVRCLVRINAICQKQPALPLLFRSSHPFVFCLWGQTVTSCFQDKLSISVILIRKKPPSFTQALHPAWPSRISWCAPAPMSWSSI